MFESNDLIHPERGRGDPHRSPETQRRLLEAASDVFADAGYRGATLREICRRAGANVAAINYHFGDKERLYLAVIENALAQSAPSAALESTVGAPGTCRPQDPAERLHGFIRDMLARLFGEGRPDRLLRLMSREHVEPTHALPLLVDRVMRPNRERLRAIIAELLGPAAGSSAVDDCTLSVLSQCISRHHSRAVVELINPGAFAPAALERLADHIFTFSLGGIRAAGAVPDRPDHRK